MSVLVKFDEGLPPLLALRGRVLKSEIVGVSDARWTAFVRSLKTASPGSVSRWNALGMFEMKPRRLVDLGLMSNPGKVRAEGSRTVWVAEWVAPITERTFLQNPRIQYRALVVSMQRYAAAITELPTGLSLSGALAVLHRCGPQGLATWSDSGKKFPATVELVARANGIF